MDRMLFVAMTGAEQSMLGQKINSNNLANLSTTGFKADLAHFKSVPITGETYDSRAYAVTESPGTDFRQGSMRETGNSLDIALNGDGFLAVQGPDGVESYTRRGDLHVRQDGFLVTGSGHFVVGDGGPISVPAAESIKIAEDGLVSIIPLNANNQATVDIGRIKLVNPGNDQLVKTGDGLFKNKAGEPFEADATARVASGFLENSNTNAVESLVNMIALARQFETQIKMMETAKQNDELSARLLQVN